MKSRPAFPARRLPVPAGHALCDLAALAGVLAIAVLSWLMISSVATALYRQFESLGDPPLVTVAVPGPGLDGRPPRGPVSQLGHTGFFWSERAFHYRTSLMFAVDDYQDPAVLSHDTWQQHPDGVDSWREYTLLMEPVYGWLYRLAGDQSRPFVEFLLRLVPLIHVLAFFALYGAARALGCRPLVAMLAVWTAATCTLGFLRLTGSLLLKEDFSLLLLTTFLAVHLAAWRTGRRGWLAAAAVLLVPLLASWHLAQFLVLVILVGAALGWAAGRQDEDRPGPVMPLAYLGAALLAALTPSLLERGFWASLPVAVLVGWAATALSAGRSDGLARSRIGRVAMFILLAAALAACSSLVRADGGDYGHVTGLLLAKLRHGFVKPGDPLLLPFDVRIFWTAPFNTPTWPEIWNKLGWHVLVLGPTALLALVAGLRPGTGALRRSFLLTVPVFAAAWLIVERLGVVFLPVGVIAAAVGTEVLASRIAARRPGRFTAAFAAVLLLGLTGLLNLGTNLGDMIRITRDVRSGRDVRLGVSDRDRHEAWRDLYAWIRRATPPGAAFLGEIGVSPQLLLYTGRPVVLNSQFENTTIRRRYEAYLKALFADDERVLWEFARDHDAPYLFINRNVATTDGPGSPAYLAGLTPGSLNEGMTAVRLHFAPENLKHFRPVYDNPVYRVFAVVGPGDPPPPVWERGFSSVWNRGNYTFAQGRLVDLRADRAALAEFESALSDLQSRQVALLAAVEDRWRRTHPGAPQRPPLLALQRRLAEARMRAPDDPDTGRLENVVRARLSEIDPRSGVPLKRALEALATGPGGWEERLRGRVAEPLHYATLGQLYALAGRYADAADRFARAASMFPLPPGGTAAPEMLIRLWQETVWWRWGAGDSAGAAAVAREALPYVPPGHPARQVLEPAAALENE